MADIAAAQHHYQHGNSREAANICRRLLQKDPDHPDANNLLGIIEFQSGNIDTGLDHLRSVCQSRPESIAARGNLAHALAEAGRVREAAQVYREALEIEPDNPDLLLRLGTLLGMEGMHEEAVDALHRVLDIVPGHPLTMVNLANTLQEAGHLDESLDLYTEVLLIDPGNLDALINLGHVWREKSNDEAALRSYGTALTMSPQRVEAHYYTGSILQRRGELDRAIEHFRMAVSVQPEFERAHWGLQQSFLLQQRPDAAGRACDACLKALPRNQMTVANQAFAHLMQGDETRFGYLYDLDTFPYQAKIATPEGWGSIEALNAALVEDILSHDSLKWQHDDYDTSDRGFAYGILEHPPASVRAFELALRASIEAFISTLSPDPHHPFLGRIPSCYGFKMWATVIQNGGWHRAHNHENAWLSGVYYAQCDLPKDDETCRGWIEFDGFTHYFDDSVHSDKVRRVRPQPGLLLFFPSYMLHATRPFQGEDYRVSIAFDVQPGNDQ